MPPLRGGEGGCRDGSIIEQQGGLEYLLHEVLTEFHTQSALKFFELMSLNMR